MDDEPYELTLARSWWEMVKQRLDEQAKEFESKLEQHEAAVKDGRTCEKKKNSLWSRKLLQRRLLKT
jgi:hypothetical protein